MNKKTFLQSRIWTLGLLVLAGLLLYYLFYPGFMSYDPAMQFDMGKSLILSDEHPVFITLIWHIASYFSTPPAFMLGLNLILCFGSLHLLSKQITDNPIYSLCFALTIIFFPPLLGMQGVLWKDIFMQNFVLLSIALMLVNRKKQKPETMIFVGSLFTLMLATFCKHNAIALALPLIFMNIQIMKPIHCRKNFITNFFYSIFLLFLFAFIQNAGTSLIACRTYFSQVTMTYDIAGTSFYKGENIFKPGYKEIMKDETSFEEIKKRYKPEHALCYYLTCSNSGRDIFFISTNPDELRLLRKNWLDAISHNFKFYLKHRLGVVKYLMGYGDFRLWTLSFDDIYRYNSGFPVKMNVARRLFIDFYNSQSTHLYFRPYFYFFAAILLVLFSLHNLIKPIKKMKFPAPSSNTYLVFCLNLSALMYTFSFFVATMSHDYRYSAYLILVVMLSLGIQLLAPVSLKR